MEAILANWHVIAAAFLVVLLGLARIVLGPLKRAEEGLEAELSEEQKRDQIRKAKEISGNLENVSSRTGLPGDDEIKP